MRKLWDKSEIDFIIKNKDSMTSLEMSKILNRTAFSISQISYKVGIKKDKSKLYKKLHSEKKIKIWNKGVKCNWISDWSKKNKTNKTYEEMYGKEKALSMKNALRENMINNNPTKNGLTEEWSKKIGKASKKMWLNQDYRKIMTEGFMGDKNPSKRPEIREKHRKSALNQWADKEKRERLLLSFNRSPNIPEKLLMSIIEKNNLPFNYVGDGKIWFTGENNQCFNPDFLSKNPKHIIEVYGDYWHNRDDMKLRDKKRLETYSKYGYKTLIIWEHELKDKNNILKKIKSFIS